MAWRLLLFYLISDVLSPPRPFACFAMMWREPARHDVRNPYMKARNNSNENVTEDESAQALLARSLHVFELLC